MSTILERQNEVIIALLARSTIGVEYIEKIVKSGKKKGKSEDFVRAYNELDGSKSITDIAKRVGVTKQNMSQVIQTWEEKGIVYNVGTTGRSVYAGLLKLPTKSKPHSMKQTKTARKPKARKISAQTEEVPSVISQSASPTTTNAGESQPQ